ncbi:MAG TPA: hypothetical protein VFL03_03170 [Candidatus Limnocylindrales bacterium]|jgi:hypothetical protein|nr:hypothetical protein [Candidatus Limnocylindrales bacterium]
MRIGRKETVHPGKPHRFAAKADPGIASVASGGFMRDNEVTSLAVTSAYERDDRRCAVSGCGRPRSDDLHAVPNA